MFPCLLSIRLFSMTWTGRMLFSFPFILLSPLRTFLEEKNDKQKGTMIHPISATQVCISSLETLYPLWDILVTFYLF